MQLNSYNIVQFTYKIFCLSTMTAHFTLIQKESVFDEYKEWNYKGSIKREIAFDKGNAFTVIHRNSQNFKTILGYYKYML